MRPGSPKASNLMLEVHRALSPLSIAVLCAALLGCATTARLHNEPLVGEGIKSGYGSILFNTEVRDFGDTVLILTFSGGGTRAAAFSYGVLQELRDTPVLIDGKPARLLDEVDTISSVSGGSFTAAYFGLYGDAIFTDFEQAFLHRSVQSQLFHGMLNPAFWFRSMFKGFDRSEMAVDQYERGIFNGATFKDLRRPGAPVIRINATDLGSGERLQFNQDVFDLICSDLDTFHVARAVAASSAVPVLFVPITLKNYAGSCGEEIPAALRRAADQTTNATRREMLLAGLSFTDSTKRPYLHLADGGVADNLGLRAISELFDAAHEVWELHPWQRTTRRLRRLVVISVDAATKHDRTFEQSPSPPGWKDVASLASETQFTRYNTDTLERVRDRVAEWAASLSSPGNTVTGRFIEVSFESVQNESTLSHLNRIATSLELPPDDVALLESEARNILRQSSEFQALLEELRESAPQPPAP